MRLAALTILAAPMLGLIASPCLAADSAFSYKTSYRNVTSDPDKVWTGDALAPNPKGTVTIHEYQLRTPEAEWLISQIWNDDCSSSTCPTRLIRLDPGGGRTVVIDDMMRQVVPTDDPRFAGLTKSGPQADYAQHPFRLSEDGKTLLNGDYKFELGGSSR